MKSGNIFVLLGIFEVLLAALGPGATGLSSNRAPGLSSLFSRRR
jgi:hypothetical protein